MADTTRHRSHQYSTEELLGELDAEVADLEAVVDWQRDQLESVRYALSIVIDEVLQPDDDRWLEASQTLYPYAYGDGEARRAETIRWVPSPRRALNFTRRELLDLANEHRVQRPGIKKWPRRLLVKALREEGVIGNTKIVR
jgi:hypothetical protein